MERTLIRRITTLLAAVLAVQCLHSQEFISHRGVVGDAYNFWVYLPHSDKAENEGLPVVVFLHGRSLCGNDMSSLFRYGTLDAVDKGLDLDAIVIAPQNPGESWKAGKLISIVNWCLEEYRGDGNRVYVIGMSLGGFGTLDFAGTFPDRIAAAVSFCGGTYLKDLSGLAEVPLWILHGKADEKVPLHESVRVADEIMAMHKDERLMYDWLDGYNHGSLARCFYMKMFYDWLFDHSLTDPNRSVNWSYTISDEDFKDVFRDCHKTPGSIPRINYKSLD